MTKFRVIEGSKKVIKSNYKHYSSYDNDMEQLSQQLENLKIETTDLKNVSTDVLEVAKETVLLMDKRYKELDEVCVKFSEAFEIMCNVFCMDEELSHRFLEGLKESKSFEDERYPLFMPENYDFVEEKIKQQLELNKLIEVN